MEMEEIIYQDYDDEDLELAEPDFYVDQFYHPGQLQVCMYGSLLITGVRNGKL